MDGWLVDKHRWRWDSRQNIWCPAWNVEGGKVNASISSPGDCVAGDSD